MIHPERLERSAASWMERDHARALVPADHAAIEATRAARVLVVEHLLRGAHADLFHACLVLGRLLAEHGGTPTLLSGTFDGALEATGASGDFLLSARAALAEGYAAATRDRARAEAMSAWDWPRCAVRIDNETMAFAAAPPAEDEEAAGRWAAKVAAGAARSGVRRAYVEGTPDAARALAEALALVGVQIVTPTARRRPWPFDWWRS